MICHHSMNGLGLTRCLCNNHCDEEIDEDISKVVISTSDALSFAKGLKNIFSKAKLK